jgi:hypothetical protein
MKNNLPEFYTDFIHRKISCEIFCSKFERWWNFEALKLNYSIEQCNSLDRVLDVVGLFTPEVNDLDDYPGYKSEIDVVLIAKLEAERWFEEAQLNS